MPRDNQGNDSNEGDNEKLPRPQVALQKKGDDRKKGCNDTTDGLRSKVEDNASHKTTQSHEHPLKGTIELWEYASETQRTPTDTTGETNEYPHNQDDALFVRSMVCAIVVIAKEIYHQRSSNQRNA